MTRKGRYQWKIFIILFPILSVALLITIQKICVNNNQKIFLDSVSVLSEPRFEGPTLTPKMAFRQNEYGMKTNTTKLIYLATNYVGKEWSKSYYYFTKNRNSFISERCHINNCQVTRDRSKSHISDAFLFHVRDVTMENLAVSRKPHQIWILYSIEPPWLELLDWRRLDGLFNWTMSYRVNSTVLVKHGYFEKKMEPTSFKKRIKYRTATNKKDAAVWFVSNCHTESRREDYVRALRYHFPVEIVGGCGKDVCRPANSRKCYLKIEKSYKFYLSFENAICNQYVTEKLFEVLNYYIVQIVFGGTNYSSSAPPGSVINAMDYPNPQDLAAFLWKVCNNDSLYYSFFDWKHNYDMFSYPWMCYLCEKLHNVKPGSISVVSNVSNWWMDESGCKTWDSEKNEFVHVHSNTIPRYNSRDFSN